MKDRIQSVDMFRGATILAMVLVNTPGTWSHVYAPLLHADWHGYTPTDLVFPFFLFIVGTSIVFSYTDRPIDANTYKKIAVRTVKLIVLGIFLGAFLVHYPFVKSFEQIRFPGVLQRIGVVFCITALLFIHVHWKKLVGITACILVGYWALMSLVPVEGMASTLDRAPNNLANWFDVQLFGSHNYKADYDPEGFLSTIPSIASALLGIFTGLILISKQEKKATILMGLGGSLLMIGHFWDLAFPINKALWTSSFVLVTGGWANLILALVYYLTDVRKVEFGAIFKYAGANAIVIYFLSSFISKVMGQINIGETSLHGWLFDTVYTHDFMSLQSSSLLYGLSVVAFYCALAYILYKRKIFIKI